MHKFIGVIGSRTLPEEYREKARGMVRYLLDKGYGIASGGAVGADAYALDALLELGQAHRGVIFSPWKHIIQFPDTVQEQAKRFIREGGRVEWGFVQMEAGRNATVAGLLPATSGSQKQSPALSPSFMGLPVAPPTLSVMPHKERIPVVVFLCGSGAELPAVEGGCWAALDNSHFGSGAFRLVYRVATASRY